MYRRQRGVTLLGWLVLLIPVAIVVYAAIRIIPVYLNYMRVAKSVDEAASAMQGISMVSDRAIRTSLEKRFDIESIDYPNVNDVTIRRDGTAWVIEAKYSDWAPLFANISLQIDFDKTAEFGG